MPKNVPLVSNNSAMANGGLTYWNVCNNTACNIATSVLQHNASVPKEPVVATILHQPIIVTESNRTTTQRDGMTVLPLLVFTILLHNLLLWQHQL